MKKITALLLAIIMILSFAACGKDKGEISDGTSGISGSTSQAVNAESESTTASHAPSAEEIKTELVPNALQGLWIRNDSEGVISLYIFDEKNIGTYAITDGSGIVSVLSGTFTVEDAEIKYIFTNGTGHSNYTYSDGVLKLTDASEKEFKKQTASEIMDLITELENVSDNVGILLLADIIIKSYPDSAEATAAAEKKAEVEEAIKTDGEAALNTLNTTYDKVEKLTWYQSKSQPKYVDTTCYIYPYIGRRDSGETWLIVSLNYTDAKTDAGWIFYHSVVFSVDGENTTKTFSRSEIVRDNDTEVWETADFEPNDTEIQLLKKIASSDETIIRFQGDEYHYDHTVTDTEKEAIKNVLLTYDYLCETK